MFGRPDRPVETRRVPREQQAAVGEVPSPSLSLGRRPTLATLKESTLADATN